MPNTRRIKAMAWNGGALGSIITASVFYLTTGHEIHLWAAGISSLVFGWTLDDGFPLFRSKAWYDETEP